MRAWVLKEIGRIEFDNVDMPMPKEGEVSVRVKAAGICGSDIPRIYETGAHVMPLIPGHEFSGVVEGIGKETDPKWLGKRVAVFPKIPCKKCTECRNGRPDQCRDYDYVGSRRDGAFAEYVTAPAENLLVLPDSVDFEDAAMMEPLAVAENAVRTGMGGEKAGMSDQPVAVCGLGPIGLMTAMLLKEAGFAQLYLVGNKDSQIERGKALDIPESHFCDSRKEDAAGWLKDVSKGGVSAFFECVGKNECISTGIKAAAPKGRLILVGNPHSDMSFSRDIYWEILRKQMTLQGIWNSVFRQNPPENEPDDWNRVLEKITEGKIRPAELISHRFALEDLEKGLLIMRDKSEDYCKVMIRAE